MTHLIECRFHHGHRDYLVRLGELKDVNEVAVERFELTTGRFGYSIKVPKQSHLSKPLARAPA